MAVAFDVVERLPHDVGLLQEALIGDEREEFILETDKARSLPRATRSPQVTTFQRRAAFANVISNVVTQSRLSADAPRNKLACHLIAAVRC